VIRLFFLLALAALLDAEDRWIEIRSGPFQVFSDADDRAARDQMMQLEQFRQGLGVVLGKQDLQLVWPVRVLVSKSGRPADLRFARDSYICTGVPRKALARLLIEQNTKRLPAGIESGIVELFSTLEVNGTRITLGAPVPAGERTRDWARMHLLTVDPAYSGRARVMISNLEQGSDLDSAYKNAFEKTVAQIEKQVDGYLAAGTFGTTNVSGRALNPARDFHVEQLDSDTAKLALGDLLLANESREAEAAYKALHGSGAAEGLGLVALKAHQDQEARRLFSSAIESGNPSARAYYEAGVLEPDAAKARTLLQKAADLNPRWSEPPYQLAQRETDLDRKAILLAKAASLDPRSVGYWQALAETYIAAKRFKDAQKAWGGAENAAATPQEREHIRQVRLHVEGERADFEAAERKRIADEQARDLERVKNASMAAIHDAEAAANKRLNPDGAPPPKPEQWWNEPEAGAKVNGTLQRFDCVGRQARVVVQTEDGKTVQLLVRDPAQIVLINGEKSLACGPQRPARNVTVGYDPKTRQVVNVEFH
jgi:hypothetical protein